MIISLMRDKLGKLVLFNECQDNADYKLEKEKYLTLSPENKKINKMSADCDDARNGKLFSWVEWQKQKQGGWNKGAENDN